MHCLQLSCCAFRRFQANDMSTTHNVLLKLIAAVCTDQPFATLLNCCPSSLSSKNQWKRGQRPMDRPIPQEIRRMIYDALPSYRTLRERSTAARPAEVATQVLAHSGVIRERLMSSIGVFDSGVTDAPGDFITVFIQHVFWHFLEVFFLTAPRSTSGKSCKSDATHQPPPLHRKHFCDPHRIHRIPRQSCAICNIGCIK